VVAEVPLDRHGGKMPWNGIRETVFGWSDQKFPFDTRRGHKLHLTEAPVVRVVGMAFYDAKHKGSRPNRRRTSAHVAVWEVHPVMSLTILPQATKLGSHRYSRISFHKSQNVIGKIGKRYQYLANHSGICHHLSQESTAQALPFPAPKDQWKWHSEEWSRYT
jgi:hypothetical protein